MSLLKEVAGASKRRGLILAAALWAFAGTHAGPAAAADLNVRMTTAGAVRGVEDALSRHFRGIPYARPPTGALRWRPPAPPAGWSGVRDAAAFGPACPQPARQGLQTSEDCLTLNVSAPRTVAPGDHLPVLVRFHGGGMVAGSGAGEHSADVWNGEGVVLVTLNYRLGPLGYFAHPLLEAEARARGEPFFANPALLDMQAALHWVHDNISAFGGDPLRVTIAGVSAGGEAVDLLLVSPGLEGLFSGAIASSGYTSWPLPRIAPLDPAPRTRFSDAEAFDEALATAAAGGAPPPSADALRALPAESLVGALKGFVLPIVDGRTLVEDPLVLFARGRRYAVPLLTGGNSFEGTVMGGSGITASDLASLLAAHAPDVERAYAADGAVSRELQTKRVFGDLRYVLSADLIARRDPQKSPIYLYYNAYVPPGRRGSLPGASHGSETLILERGTDVAGSPALAMRRYWSNFIKSGDPNVPNAGPVSWPVAGREHPFWMVFDDRIEVRRDLLADRLRVLAAVHDDFVRKAP